MSQIALQRANYAAIGAALGAVIGFVLSAVGVVEIFKLSAGLILPMALIGALIGQTRLRHLLTALAALCLIGFLVLQYSPVAEHLGAGLIRRDKIAATPPDAVLVLSGGMNSDGTLVPITLDRVLSGIELAKNWGVPLLLSRELRLGPHPLSDSVDLQRILSLTGNSVPTFFADSTTSTRDEAVRMMRIASSHHWKRVAVVTSPLHTRRACATFEAVGFKVTCVPAIARTAAIFPNGHTNDRVAVFRNWLYETAGSINYRMKGWI